MESRALDRVTSFTDAAVAIALTLLVLPLLDIAKEVEHTPVGTVLRENTGDLLAFLLSYVVIGTYWRVHRRLFEQLAGVDNGLLHLNAAWLLGVVFLPVPTAMLSIENASPTATTFIYLGNLLFVAVAGLVLGLWIRAHPGIQRPGAAETVRRQVRRGVAVCSAMTVITALAIPLSSVALILLCALPVASDLVDRTLHHHPPSP